MPRVAIVDDHPIARRGLQSTLRDAGEIRVVASVAVPAELVDCLQDPDRCPDVVVLDLYHDGDVPCIDAVRVLSATTRVLVISASGRAEDVLGAIRAGAAGYATKQTSEEMIISAVRTVAGGGFWLSSQLADILHSELTHPAPRRQAVPRGGALSAREEQTLALIAEGFTYAQVATRMGVSKATVDTYIELCVPLPVPLAATAAPDSTAADGISQPTP